MKAREFEKKFVDTSSWDVFYVLCLCEKKKSVYNFNISIMGIHLCDFHIGFFSLLSQCEKCFMGFYSLSRSRNKVKFPKRYFKSVYKYVFNKAISHLYFLSVVYEAIEHWISIDFSPKKEIPSERFFFLLQKMRTKIDELRITWNSRPQWRLQIATDVLNEFIVQMYRNRNVRLWQKWIFADSILFLIFFVT